MVHFYDPMHWETASKSGPLRAFLEQQLSTKAGRNIGALVLSGEPFTGERWTGHISERSLPAIWFMNPHASLKAKLPSDFLLSGNALYDGKVQ